MAEESTIWFGTIRKEGEMEVMCKDCKLSIEEVMEDLQKEPRSCAVPDCQNVCTVVEVLATKDGQFFVYVPICDECHEKMN